MVRQKFAKLPVIIFYYDVRVQIPTLPPLLLKEIFKLLYSNSLYFLFIMEGFYERFYRLGELFNV